MARVTAEQRMADYKAEEIIEKCYLRKWSTQEIVEDQDYIYFGINNG